MDMIKRIIAVTICAVLMLGLTACGALLAAGCLAGCGGNENKLAEGKKSVVVTIFPEYDWVKSILGDDPAGMEVTMLLDNGVDLHSYQPTAEDILKIASCDLFIYVGGESDEWVEDALAQAVNKDMKTINLLEVLGDKVREEEEAEGMQEEEHEEEEEEGPEYDEHVWLSLKNAQILCGSIAEALGQVDPAHKDVYQANVKAYQEKLAALDAEYQKTADAASVKTLLFGDRFPFLYLTEDYGLDYYAAFKGCSAETEASFETVAFLAGKADELSLSCVMTLEGTDHRLAETIVQNTAAKDLKILTMDSMQGTTSKDVEAGATYLTIMQKNLEVLKEALQ